MIPGSANPLLLKSAAAGGLQISRSLRFNSSDSAYLSKASANITTFTLSAWLKRCGSGRDDIFVTNSSTGFYLYFNTDGSIRVNDNTANQFISNGLYRDPSAWYHIVVNNNGSTFNLYVNGVLDKTVSANLPLYSGSAYIGTNPFSSYANYYLTNIHFIDGQALTPSSFTETDATTGQLIPKTYTGTYGTNGYNLLFADNSSNTASTLGKDYSGLGNNWTPNNLSVTAGAGNDSLVDSPTNYGTDTYVGGEVRGNYATLNPLAAYSTGPMSNGCLEYGGTSTGGYQTALSTIFASSGKYYAEFTLISGTVTDCLIGVGSPSFPWYNSTGSSYVGYTVDSYGYVALNGNKYNNGSGTSYGNSYTINDVIGIALDIDNGKVWFSKNGTWQNSGNPASGTNAAFSSLSGPLGFLCSAYSTGKWSANFGQRAFAYTAPSGFKALCTQNLPAPLVTKSNTVMDVVTYTGTGAALTPTSSLGFNPDWIWIKSRSAATDHALYDVVRGAQARLESNTTDAEVTTDGGVTAFNSAGFTLGTLAQVNTSAATYVAWCWDAGTSTVSNTQGSITSQVRANATAGFSVVTATKTSGTHSVGHGLGVTPGLIIVKNRAATSDWIVAHSALNMSTQLVYLNKTDSVFTSTPLWGGAPTSSVFYVAGTMLASNDFVAYCFAPVVGYSNGFSYTGNGSADGSFVYLGFRPRLIMLKRSDSTSNWTLLDTSREGYNVDNDPLYPNTADAEGTADLVDITSNGFKLRTTDASVNASAGTYIGFAWAEMPFNYSRAR